MSSIYVSQKSMIAAEKGGIDYAKTHEGHLPTGPKEPFGKFFDAIVIPHWDHAVATNTVTNFEKWHCNALVQALKQNDVIKHELLSQNHPVASTTISVNVPTIPPPPSFCNPVPHCIVPPPCPPPVGHPGSVPEPASITSMTISLVVCVLAAKMRHVFLR